MLPALSYGKSPGCQIPANVSYIQVLLKELSIALGAEHLFVSVLDAELEEASTVYYLVKQRRLDNFIYSLDDSPCSELFSASSPDCEVYQNSYRKYPFSNFPCVRDIRTYMGIPIFDQHGFVIGILVAMFYKPIQVTKLLTTLLKNTAQLITARAQGYFQSMHEHDVSTEGGINQYLLEVIDKFTDVVLLLNQYGVIERANSAISQTLGYAVSEVQGVHLCELLTGAESALNMSYIQEFLSASNSEVLDINRRVRLNKSSGKELQVELKLSRLNLQGGNVFLLLLKDMTQSLEVDKTIYRMAYYDDITQIKNRNCFEHDVRHLLRDASAHNAYVYCALLDIDQMTKLNLNFGIEGGNYCIRFVAKRLQQLLTAEFQVYKSGVDSFFIVYRQRFATASPDGFSRHMMEQNLLCSQHFTLEIKQQIVPLSLSLGCAVFKAKNYSYEALVNTLEFAKNEAKRLAPFGHFFMKQDQQQSYRRSNHIRSQLYKAIRNEEFFLLLQPQYTQEQRIVASEALLRWQSNELGMVFPDEFIPIAEQSGAIIDIGYWIIDKVCQLLYQCDKEGIKTKIAVNISGKQMMHEGFKTELLRILHKWRVRPASLILELTETSLVEDIEVVKALMLELDAMGFMLSIDDFGTGYSSLSYLKVLPISELKIDRYFVHDIKDNNVNSEHGIIQLIVNMARILKVKTVAEGVETKLQYDYLRSINCDMYQGYLFTKPIPVNEWRALLISNPNCSLALAD